MSEHEMDSCIRHLGGRGEYQPDHWWLGAFPGAGLAHRGLLRWRPLPAAPAWHSLDGHVNKTGESCLFGTRLTYGSLFVFSMSQPPFRLRARNSVHIPTAAGSTL